MNNNIWKDGVVLSFDLDTNKLREYYHPKYPENAYDVIRRFLEKKGFEHLRDTDYVNYHMNKKQTLSLLKEFNQNQKWFPACKTKVIISPNNQSLDVSKIIDKDIDKNWLKEKKLEIQQQKQKAPIPNIDFSEIKEEKTLSIKP